MTSPQARKKRKPKPKPEPPKYTMIDELLGRAAKVDPFKNKVNPFQPTDG